MIGIILGGRSNALSVARSLADVNCERHVLSTCDSHVCRSSIFVDQFFFFNTFDKVLNALGMYDKKEIKVIYPTSDIWVRFLSENEKYLKSKGFFFVTLPKKLVDVVLDKFVLYKRFGDVLLMPETVLASQRKYFSKNKSYIVKPRQSFLGEAVVKKGFRLGSESNPDFIIQQRLSMKITNHHSFSGVAQQGRVVFGGLTHKVLEYPSPGGTATLVVYSNDSSGLYKLALNKASKFVSSIGYEGVFEMEFIFHEGRLWFLEFNPRFWLQHNIFLAIGVNVVKIYTDICLGGVAQNIEVKRNKKVVWLHEGFLVSLLRTRCNLIEVIRCLFWGKWVFAYWRINDPKPFFRFVRELICKKS